MKELRFIHITKNAGTSIENIANNLNICWGRFDPIYKSIQSTYVEKWHVTGHLKQKYDYFCVVRNPYERIISEFHCKYSNPQISKIEWTKELFNKHIQTKITNSMKLVKHHSHPGGHYCPQHYYILDTVKINVIKYENIDTEFSNLMKQYSIPLKLDRHDNKTSKKIFSPFDFDETSNDLINTFYSKDFEMFDYAKIIL